MEYIAFDYIAEKTIQIKRFTNKIMLNTIDNVILYSNNKMNIALIKIIESQYQIKYINIQNH